MDKHLVFMFLNQDLDTKTNKSILIYLQADYLRKNQTKRHN